MKLRCDGKRPTCERCKGSASLCQYTPGRRRRSQIIGTADVVSKSASTNTRIRKSGHTSKQRSSDFSANANSNRGRLSLRHGENIDLLVTAREEEWEEDLISDEATTSTTDDLLSTNILDDQCQEDSVLLQPLLSMFDENDMTFSNPTGGELERMTMSDVNLSEFDVNDDCAQYFTPELTCATSDDMASPLNLQDVSNEIPGQTGQNWDELSNITFPVQLEEKHASRSQLQFMSSTKAAKYSPGSTSADCICLQSVVKLLENVTETVTHKSDSLFDRSLIQLKEAISQCFSYLKCPCCIARSEFCMILILTTEKIVYLSEKEVAQLVSKFQVGECVGKSKSRQDQLTSSFGSYPLSISECLLVSRMLIALHLDTCRKFVNRLRGIPHVATRDSQLDSLLALEARVGKLLDSLGRLSLSSTE